VAAQKSSAPARAPDRLRSIRGFGGKHVKIGRVARWLLRRYRGPHGRAADARDHCGGRARTEVAPQDRAAGVTSDEIVKLGKSRPLAGRPDHPVRLIRVEVKPHESYRGMRGPRCDGTLRIVTNRLDLPAELIAEIYRQRWLIESSRYSSGSSSTYSAAGTSQPGC